MNVIEKAAELKQQLQRERNYWQGRKLHLYQAKYNPEGYTDQHGKKHAAEVITAEVDVTIT